LKRRVRFIDGTTRRRRFSSHFITYKSTVDEALMTHARNRCEKRAARACRARPCKRARLIYEKPDR